LSELRDAARVLIALRLSKGDWLLSRGLRRQGIRNIGFARVEHLVRVAVAERPEAVVINRDLHEAGKANGAVLALREAGYRGVVVVVGAWAGVEEACEAAVSGADLFVVLEKSRGIGAVAEAIAWGLARRRDTGPLALGAYLRSIGFTRQDLGVVFELLREFGLEKQIADRMGASEGALRVRLSRMYRRLGARNRLDMAHVLGRLSVLDLARVERLRTYGLLEESSRKTGSLEPGEPQPRPPERGRRKEGGR